MTESAHPSPSSTASGLGTPAWWRSRSWRAKAWWPLSRLYGGLVGLRRWAYVRGWLKTERAPCPVLVVGNVVAGGAGKTPVVIALVKHLQAQGWHPGVVSRGHGRQTQDCRPARPDSDPRDVGDEPALIARQTQAPVFVARRRIEAVRALCAAHPDTDVIVCDDGLQHLALARDLEICVFNEDGVGNGWLLPAGPLREPWPRPVDAVLHAGLAPQGGTAPRFALTRQLAPYARNAQGEQVLLSTLQGAPLHAVAGIARPERFFAMLRAQGLRVERAEAFPDHSYFDSLNRTNPLGLRLICTEKDAIKLWARHPDALAVPLEVRIAPAFFAWIDARLSALTARPVSSAPSSV